jgi:Glycosyltransferase family 87
MLDTPKKSNPRPPHRCYSGGQPPEIQALVRQHCAFTALWLILGAWGWLWLGPVWINAMQPARSRINDFYQDWGSARNYLIGLRVYTHHATSIPRHLGLPSNPVPSIEYNAHPPTSVLLALPLAQLDYPYAVLAWNIGSLVALLASMVIIARELGINLAAVLPTVALLAICHPVYANIYQGQLTLTLAFLVTASWALERSNRPCTAGLFLGAAAAIKLFPAYLAVYYAARWRYRPILTAAFSFLALTALTVSVLGVDTYYDYVFLVLQNQAKFRSFAYNLSIAGFWHKLFSPAAETGPVQSLYFSPALARWATLVSNLAITIIVMVVAHRARSPRQCNLAFAATITAMLLVSPVTWDFSLPLLLVPFALIAHCAHTSRTRWAMATLLLILAIDWVPQNLLTEIWQVGRSSSTFPWTFMLGAPSLKFYALLGTFLLGLASFMYEMRADTKARCLTGAPADRTTHAVT